MVDSEVVWSPDSENRTPEVWKSSVYPLGANNNLNNGPSPLTSGKRTGHANSNRCSWACSTQNSKLWHSKTDHIWNWDSYPIHTRRDPKSPSALFVSCKLFFGVVWSPDCKNRMYKYWNWQIELRDFLGPYGCVKDMNPNFRYGEKV